MNSLRADRKALTRTFYVFQENPQRISTARVVGLRRLEELNYRMGELGFLFPFYSLERKTILGDDTVV